ncbi:MAG: DNA gyrase subunit A [Acetobacter sp.]|nr:DNA gyrase subunit A [Acetobacter sp.]
MRTSYLAYAMSVIVSRALPDVRDGLKPVHRRILYAMHESGISYDKPHRKSARVVGEVMGKYHPHGDSAIYDAMVRMAQPWSMRVKLIDGQGNFGSLDGDSPAAMRYTEARLDKAATFLLDDIDRNTVDFQPNYDESESEPVVLPTTFPNLLVNGAQGIAVGMATNIPTHNPLEVIEATLALIRQPDMTLEDIMTYIPGPDFPTGGFILGRSGIRSAYTTGRGTVIMRARVEIEDIRKDRKALVITEIPYQVNKATLQERIADLVRTKQIEGITDIRDESDRSGVRVVIEIKRDATPEIVLNHLYRFTQLQTSFGINMLALDNGQPRLMGLRDVLEAFITFREEVITRRARFDLGKARDRGHLLVGLVIAVLHIDRVIAIIRAAPDTTTARENLIKETWEATEIEPLLHLIHDEGNVVVDGRVTLTDKQARGILDLRLQRLTGLERSKIQQELSDVAKQITELLEILSSHQRRMEILTQELIQARQVISTPRVTQILDDQSDQDDESLIEPGQMVITITRDGFIKRTPIEVFRAQNRGGRGRSGASTRGDDCVIRSFNAHTHQWVMFFSSRGKVYREKVWRLPEGAAASRGRALVNFLPDLGTDSITAILPLPQDEATWEQLNLVFATASGYVRRNKLSDFRHIRLSGLIAMKLEEEDHLIGVATCCEGQDVFLATRQAQCIRFRITDETLRVFAGRASLGVRGIRLAEGDQVISLAVLNHVEASMEERAAYLRLAATHRGEEITPEETPPEEGTPESLDAVRLDAVRLDAGRLDARRFAELAAAEEFLLVVSEDGLGRRSSTYDYRVTGRGGKGITNMVFPKAREHMGVAATLPVQVDADIMLVTDAGRLIRVPVEQVRIMSRRTIGVKILRLDQNERVTSVFPVMKDEAESAETPKVSDGSEGSADSAKTA